MYSENQLLKVVENKSKENGIDLGNTTIDGVLKVNEYELDEDITISNLPTNMTSYFAHARVSNGKLNIVIALGLPSDTAVSNTAEVKIGELELPNSILVKLIPYVAAILITEVKYLSYGAFPFIQTGKTMLRILKDTGKINLYLSQEANDAIAFTSIVRFEINFIL